MTGLLCATDPELSRTRVPVAATIRFSETALQQREVGVAGGAIATGDRRHHGNRHGRSEQARIAVLQAADDLLVERGFAGLTVEGIAATAGVAKQTICRWWPSKTEILFDWNERGPVASAVLNVRNSSVVARCFPSR